MAKRPALSRGVCVGLVLLAGSACGGKSKATKTEPTPTLTTPDGVAYLATEVIVKRSPEAPAGAFEAALKAAGGKVVDDGGPMRDLGYVKVVLPAGASPDQVIVDLKKKGVVTQAERNYVIERQGTPNDPRMGELWGLTKINAPRAWDIGTGSTEVLVLVSDTGIDYTHPDLAGNAWKNAGEIAGNGKDDDGNGYVDDVYGYDFINKDGDPKDDHGHGTHVSGTIGAVGNDGAGVVGVNWKVKLAGAKVLSSTGSGGMWEGAQSLLYAAKLKARVVNASWGCPPGPSCYASYFVDALKTLNAAGGLFVAAAGNNANDNDAQPTYPGSYGEPNVLAVGATTNTDGRASFSSRGATKVHLFAPGVGILSTLPGGSYASWNGTSMATPHVAGAAALYLAIHPEATPVQVKERLMATGAKNAELAKLCASGARLDAAALMLADGDAPGAPTGVKATMGEKGDVTVSWAPNKEADLAGYRARATSSAGAMVEQEVARDTTSARFATLTQGTSYKFVVFARDAAGNVSPASAEVTAEPRDTLAPPAVVDLTAEAIAGNVASGQVTAASGELSMEWRAENAADGSLDTGWVTPPRPAAQEEYVIVTLNKAYFVERVELHANRAYPEFFPVDFDVELSSDGSAWKVVGGERGFAVDRSKLDRPVTVSFPGQWASAMRVRVLKAAKHISGLFYAGLGEIAAREVPSVSGGVRLRFTAPGDDPGEGRAASYDLRMATSPFDATSFANATKIPGNAPASAGTLELVTVKDLKPETRYWFALTATDDAGNVSPVSNIASTSTAIQPPSTVTDLRQVAGPKNAITLAWTAPGSDGNVGRATRYELRYASSPLDPGTFDAATEEKIAAPKEAGQAETAVVEGLKGNTVYYFALRAVDMGGATGGLSNVVMARIETKDDKDPPAAAMVQAFPSLADVGVALKLLEASPSDQVSTGGDKAVDGVPYTAFRAAVTKATDPAWLVLDLGAATTVSKLRLLPDANLQSFPQDFELQASADRLTWTSFLRVTGARAEDITWQEWATPATPTRYVRLFVTQRGRDSFANQANVAEIELRALTPEFEANLFWIAPGDDGWIGQASKYELRMSESALTDANFAQAQAIATRTPQAAGQIETYGTGPLPPERTLYFAVRTADETGNWSALSNVAKIETPAVPPGAITDLRATARGTSAIELTFTATGDDGPTGTATSYDLRLARAPITADNWGSAVGIPAGKPQKSGSAESVLVEGLASNSVYYFAIRAVDDRGATGLISNVAVGETGDGLPPGQIVDLVAAPVDPSEGMALPLAPGDVTGSRSPETGPKNLLDGNDTTAWLSPARTELTEERVTLTLPGQRKVARVRLRAAAGYLDLVPVDFRVEARVGSDAWKTVVNETGFASAGGWEEWTLGGVPATELRLVVTKAARWGGSYTVAVGDLEVFEDLTETSRMRLTWTATGDDDRAGQAKSYDLRRAGAPITADSFASATPVAGAPAPGLPGTLERMEAAGLLPETTYCFALKAVDDAALAGKASPSSCAKTPGLPPGSVLELRATEVTATSAKLAWTAPGGDGANGKTRAARYELRRAKSRITSANWKNAELLTGLPTPGDMGKAETFTATGLTGLNTYYFALRAVDESNNWSGLSNNATANTLDDVAPGRVSDLAAVADKTQTGTLLVSFTAPGDNGALGQAKSYDLRIASAPIDATTFAAAKPVPTSAPQAAGSKEAVTLKGLSPEARYYLALRTTDAAGNVSALSNVVEAWTRDEAPSAVLDLALSDAKGTDVGNGRVTVSWTAPGDDGSKGTVTRYDLRYADAALTAATFAQAKAATSVPPPLPAGSKQQAVLSGLPIGKSVFVALVAYDDRGNASPLSNVANLLVPDQAAPAAVTDLLARTGVGTGRIDLTFTAPGDDGTTGTAQSYELRWALGPISEASWSAAKVVSAPTPAAAGTPQIFAASGLPDEALVFLALRAKDDAGNWSPVSNSASARTADVAPAAISTLKQSGKTGATVTLTFTAPGDDGNVGTATAYDLRTAADPITDATFGMARAVPITAPQPAGKLETVSVGGLKPNQKVYVAVKALDDRGTWSALSNVVLAETIDDQAPGAVTDLRAQTGTAAGTIALTFTAPGDDGSNGTARSYDLRRATTPITEASFAAATAVTAPAPKAAGSAEAITASALDGETVYYFAVRATDEAGNVGPLSNVANARTPAVAPAAVTDLSATRSGGNLTVSWTAPGDDGAKGTATLYDLRMSKSAIGDTTFTSEAAVPGVPTPAVAGTRQSVTVSGLSESTDYYFALKTKDDTDTWSGLSNVLKVTTPDRTAPGAPTNLTVTTPTSTDVEIPVIGAEATSSLGLSWMPPHLFDGRPDTAWASAGGTGDVESFTADLGKIASIDRVKLLPDGAFARLFPRDFVIEVSADKTAWKAVVSEEEMVTSEASWLTWGFPATEARYVRVTVGEANQSFGKRYAIVAEIEVWAAAPTDGRALLGWVNPGDDGMTGAAKSLEVYRHTAPFDAGSLAAATKVAGAPTPNVAGSLAQMNVNGLLGETTHYWAVRAIDESGNAGALSTVVAATTNAVAPAPIANLAGEAGGQTSVTLTWTAPGDDAQVGRAASYELRRATGPLTSQSWALATLVPGAPAPADAGTKQSFTVTGLQAGTVHRFAIVTRDEAGNASYLSNVATVATAPGPDTKGPDAITDLVVRLPAPSNTVLSAKADAASSEQLPDFTAAALADSDRDSAWASAGRDSANKEEWVRLDLGSLQDTDHVRLWPSANAPELFPRSFVVRTSPDGLAFTTVGTRTGVSATAFVPFDMSFPTARVRFVEVRATELSRSGAGLFYAVVAEAEVLTPSEAAGTVFASFTAPADDGPSRRAASYDLRVGSCPYDHASAAAFTTGAPAEAGSPERFRLSSVPTGRRCVGVISRDDAGNLSPLSNVVQIDVR